MKAVVYDRFGPPAEVLRLEEVPEPDIGEDEALVRVVAASANPYDWHWVRGEPSFMRLGPAGFLKPKHRIPGGDLAGIVEKVGSAVPRRVGDEVYAFAHGAFAELIAIPQDRLALKPSNMTFEEAASVPLGAVTALQGLRDQAGVEDGDRVLIIGASGGVGIFAVQMAKAMGAHVTGVCSTGNVDFVDEVGADEVIDYTTGDFTRSDDRYDVIFQLGGTYTARQLRRIMTSNGTLVQAMGDGGQILGPLLNMLGGQLLKLFIGQDVRMFTAKETGEELETIRQMIEAGDVRTFVDKTYPFAETGSAIAHVEDGSPQGKIVINVAPAQARGEPAG